MQSETSSTFSPNIVATVGAQHLLQTQEADASFNLTAYDELKRKLTSREAKVGVIGLGYVGLPLCVAFADGGYTVLGFDIDARKVDELSEGRSYIQDVKTEDVAKHVKANKISAYTQFTKLKDCDVMVVCVPTPLSKSKDPDMSYIVKALEKIEGSLTGAGQLIILESTTYPGTTREVMQPGLEKAGKKLLGRDFKCGEDFFLAFSPERVDPGNPTYHTTNTPKVVGGVTGRCGELAAIFYSNSIQKVIRVSSPDSAEMVKLLENTFRQINIGLVNEVAIMCSKLGIDCWEVIEAAATKPFGFMPFYPGPGLGGHCIPVDPSYLSWKLRSLNYTARFIELANAVNTEMPEFVVEKIAAALNEDCKSVKKAKILLMGVAYKKDIDDLRESPSLDILHLLLERGAEVEFYDPFVPTLRYQDQTLESLKWTDRIAEKFDAVVISTDHTKVDYANLLKYSKRVIDTRNALKGSSDPRISKL